jgi:hypothetical protein
MLEILGEFKENTWFVPLTNIDFDYSNSLGSRKYEIKELHWSLAISSYDDNTIHI